MKFSFTAFFLLCCQTVFCQWSVNIHGGYASINMVNHATYTQPDHAYSVGLGGTYTFKHHIAAVAEVNYELKGAQGSINYYNIVGDKVLSYNKQLQLHYVTVPVMARYSIGEKGIQAFVNAGMYYGYLAGAWVNPQTKGISHDVTADFKRIDFGLASGVGMLLHFNNMYSISLEWRNNYGLTNVGAQSTNQYNRTNLFQLAVQYHIPDNK
jgi:hypothetical protein